MDVSTGASAVRDTIAMPVEDASHVSAARRRAGDLARALDFDEDAAGRVALAVTEAATNILKHGGRGEILLGVTQTAGLRFVDVLALDRGPGMANVDRCFEDGFSTAGSAGTGLGAVRRLASAIDVYSRPGGTALLMRIGPGTPGRVSGGMTAIGGLSVAVGGEDQCGDAWDHESRAGVLTVLVVDGLGHGAGASEAARECVRAFRLHPGTPPAARVGKLHEALRGTRGAALAVTEIDPGRRVVRFAGLGNITASVYGEGPVRHLVSHHGIAGHNAGKIAEYTYPWPGRGVLIMHSDGLATLRHLDPYPGLLERDTGLIAGVLYRDFSRRRDDATVVVARASAP
jgi:anti-sigma regulatory factor (Ser/Thr protein kinase)